MKTRTGNVVFLEDILDEARNVILERMMQNSKGKLSQIDNPHLSADLIAISAVVIQDLSARRTRDYSFDWNRMTNMEGSTGPYLQYV